MDLILQVWRQKDARTPGRFEIYEAKNIIPDMSFLEMLDVVNEQLIARGREPIALLVVPPGTPVETARAAMNTAATGPGTAQAAEIPTAEEAPGRR